MGSIYEIEEWSGASGDKWQLNEVVLYAANGKHYYAIKSHNRSYDGTVNPSYANSAHWGGHTTYNNATIPHFFWIADYGAGISSEPQVDVIQFGDGYEQRTPQNISADLLKLDLSFNNRDEKEATAIAHFLHTRGAKEAFAFTPPSPYGSIRKFICRSWDVTMAFHNNFSIKASFEEVVS